MVDLLSEDSSNIVQLIREAYEVSAVLASRLVVSGRFDTKSFRYKSFRYKPKSFRYTCKVVSIHM